MTKLGEFFSKTADNVLSKMTQKVNTAAKQVDLSGVKTPTIKTDNKVGFPPLFVAGVIGIIAIFVFGKR